MARSCYIHWLVGCILGFSACRSTGTPIKPTTHPPEVTQAGDETWRQQIPVVSDQPLPSIQLPTAHQSLLPNGLKIVAATKTGLPLAHVMLHLQIGPADEKPEQAGIASLLLASMEHGGSWQYPKAALHQQLTDLGSTLEFTATASHLRIEATVELQDVPVVLKVLADLMQHALLDGEAVAQGKLGLQAEFQTMKSSPIYSGRLMLAHQLYGQRHPLGRPHQGLERTLHKLQPKDVVAFYRKFVGPQRATLFVVGAMTPEQAYQAGQSSFAQWQNQVAPKSKSLEPVDPPGQRLTIVQRAKAPQTFVLLGTRLILPPNHPDAEPLMCAQEILGGMFQSRINLNLREEKALTYGARSALILSRLGSHWMMYSSVEARASALAFQEMLGEFDRLLKEGITAQELASAVDYIVLTLPGRLQGVADVSHHFLALYEHDLPFDYDSGLASRLSQLKVEQINQVVQRHMKDRPLIGVLVGDGEEIQRQLSALSLPAGHWVQDMDQVLQGK